MPDETPPEQREYLEEKRRHEEVDAERDLSTEDSEDKRMANPERSQH
jgi:hypothetical protein